jgi:uncharacterized protein with GYD domain
MINTIFAQNAFIGNTSTDIRYLWDPVVHDRFGERCYLMFISLHRPDGNSLHKFEEIASSSGIQCHSAYIVFGTFDMVARLWAFPSAYDEFYSQVRREMDIRTIDDVTCVHVDYSGWSPTIARTSVRPTVPVVAAHHRDVVNVCDSRATPEAGRESMASLEASGLVHKLVPPTLSPGSCAVKLYIGVEQLDHQGRRHSSDLRDADALQRFVDHIAAAFQNKSEFKVVSLYFCRGRYECVIKAILSSESLIELSDLLFSLQEELSVLGENVRFETMIVGGQSTPERDTINPDSSELGPTGQLMAFMMLPELRPTIQGLREPWRSEVFRVFEDWYARFLGDPEFGSTFVSIIESGLRCSLEDLWLSFNFAIRLEHKARQAIVREAFPRTLGDGWHGALLQILRADLAREISATGADGSRTEVNLSIDTLRKTIGKLETDSLRLSIGEYVGCLRRAMKHGLTDSDSIGQVLGENWGTWIEQLRELRNVASHYNDIEDLADANDTTLVGRWKELAEQALRVADSAQNYGVVKPVPVTEMISD